MSLLDSGILRLLTSLDVERYTVLLGISRVLKIEQDALEVHD